MSEVELYLQDRKSELQVHLDLLDLLDKRSKDTTNSDENFKVDVRQILIMKSSIIVHIYNIVESTFTKTLTVLQDSVGAHHPKVYIDGIFELWIAGNVQINSEFNIKNVRDNVRDVGKALIGEIDYPPLSIKKTDGNWDEKRIQKLSDKLGVELVFQDEFKQTLERHYFNELTRLQYIRKRRNDLAHGFITFEEGADGKTLSELEELSETAIGFMEIVVDAYNVYMKDKKFVKAA